MNSEQDYLQNITVNMSDTDVKMSFAAHLALLGSASMTWKCGQGVLLSRATGLRPGGLHHDPEPAAESLSILPHPAVVVIGIHTHPD